MEIKEFVKMLDRKQSGYHQFTEKELQIAKDNAFVIVYGASDDLMEFEGAICDEAGCYEGGSVLFNRNGAYYDEEKSMAEYNNVIIAIWCGGERDKNGKEITWTYETSIPHETFMIYEDDEPYCRGIVFSVNNLK